MGYWAGLSSAWVHTPIGAVTRSMQLSSVLLRRISQRVISSFRRLGELFLISIRLSFLETPQVNTSHQSSIYREDISARCFTNNVNFFSVFFPQIPSPPPPRERIVELVLLPVSPNEAGKDFYRHSPLTISIHRSLTRFQASRLKCRSLPFPMSPTPQQIAPLNDNLTLETDAVGQSASLRSVWRGEMSQCNGSHLAFVQAGSCVLR